MHMPIDFVFGLHSLQKQNPRDDREEERRKGEKEKKKIVHYTDGPFIDDWLSCW